ncbi:hypothetical protein KM043_004372 [Ampulex compressa]|nr:hypothetical protein KM043_004372 [Ampulex compressa]
MAVVSVALTTHVHKAARYLLLAKPSPASKSSGASRPTDGERSLAVNNTDAALVANRDALNKLEGLVGAIDTARDSRPTETTMAARERDPLRPPKTSVAPAVFLLPQPLWQRSDFCALLSRDSEFPVQREYL